MRTLYADASALLRVLFNEPGPRLPLGEHAVVASSAIVEVETFRAVDRARLTGHLNDEETAQKNYELSEMLARIHILSVSDEVIERARATFPVNVRALDAIHVATAELLATEVGQTVLWTHDRRQATAAAARAVKTMGGSDEK